MKSIAACVLDLLRADPDIAWSAETIAAALPDVKSGTLNTTLSTLCKSDRAIRPCRGYIQAGPNQEPINSAPGRRRRVMLTPAIEAACRIEEHDDPAERTPRQHEAYLRNLVARACIAVQIDLKLSQGADSAAYLAKLQRWGQQLFDMGYRAGAGLDIPPDKMVVPEMAQ